MLPHLSRLPLPLRCSPPLLVDDLGVTDDMFAGRNRLFERERNQKNWYDVGSASEEVTPAPKLLLQAPNSVDTGFVEYDTALSQRDETTMLEPASSVENSPFHETPPPPCVHVVRQRIQHCK